MTPTETNVHGAAGDALCFMGMGPSLLERLVVGGWWLAVGGGWWRLMVGGCWGLAAGSWWLVAVRRGWQLGWQRLAVGGPWGLCLRAVLSKKNGGKNLAS